MSNDILFPLLIVAGAILLGLVVHLVKRPRPSREDIVAPTVAAPKGRKVSAAVAPATPTNDSLSAEELLAWHQEHESAVLSWMEAHEDAAAEPDQYDGPTEAHAADMADAVSAHPSPIMSAELSALQVAGTACLRALHRENPDAASEHHQTYLRYRSDWVDRLWQFAQDRTRVGDLRNTTTSLAVPLSVDDTDIDDTQLDGDTDLDDTELETAADFDGPLPPLDPDEPDDEPTGKHAAIKLADIDAEADADDLDGADGSANKSRFRRSSRR